MSEEVFDNREDVIRTLNRLLTRQLVEVDTRATDSVAGADKVRVTSSGWYYCRFLVKSFPYLDLVLQDTPLNDPGIEVELRGFVRQVDNLAGRDEEKVARVEVRFARVRAFLDYLSREEERERTVFNLQAAGNVWGVSSFTSDIKDQIEREIEWIARRLRENRELFPEEISVWNDDREAIGFDGQSNDEDDALIPSSNAL